MQGAGLAGAQLQGADLGGAQVHGAKCTSSTSWPARFNWKAAGVNAASDID
jgi:hypothetical protein